MSKSRLKTLLALVALTSFGISMPATSVSAKTFSNCTELRMVYPKGVAKSATAAAKQKNKPKVSASIYKSNIKMDRDNDGTVCEK